MAIAETRVLISELCVYFREAGENIREAGSGKLEP